MCSSDLRPAITTAGLLVQEDLIMIQQKPDEKFYLTAGSLCFPSDWSLKEKLGLPIQEIHSPIPTLNRNLGKTIDLFLAKMQVQQQYWRVNFLLSTSPQLSQLKNVEELNQYRKKPITRENIHCLYLRNERETLTKLKESKNIIFTLKTYITAFHDLHPITAQQLALLIEAMPKEALNKYRLISEPEKEIILEYLWNKVFEYKELLFERFTHLRSSSSRNRVQAYQEN